MEDWNDKKLLPSKEPSSFNHMIIGLVIGFMMPIVFSPAVAYYLIYQANGEAGMEELINRVMKVPDQASIFLSLCVLINLPIFLLASYKKLTKTNQGMLMATIAYCIVVFILKLI